MECSDRKSIFERALRTRLDKAVFGINSKFNLRRSAIQARKFLWLVWVVCLAFMVSCSGGGNGLMGPDDGTDGARSDYTPGLVSEYCRNLCWYGSDFEIAAENYNESRVDISDVRTYYTSVSYTGDIIRHEDAPNACDDSIVVYVWQVDVSHVMQVKWRVGYYDDNDSSMHYSDVYTVPNDGNAHQAYPAVTAYINPLTDKMTVHIVFQRLVSNTWQIFHEWYEQGTANNYNSFSPESSYHASPYYYPERVCIGSYNNWHPDAVWWGRYDATNGNRSRVFAVYEHYMDSDGGCGDVRIAWCYFDEDAMTPEWCGHALIDDPDGPDNDEIYDLSHYPRIDVGQEPDLNSGDWIWLAAWHEREQASYTWEDPTDIDIKYNWHEADDTTPDISNFGELFYQGDEAWDMLPIVDFDLPRNDTALIHCAFTHFDEDWYMPKNMYWNSAMWVGDEWDSYPEPEVFRDSVYDEGLTSLAVCADRPSGTDYDIAYATWIQQSESGPWYVYATEINYYDNDDPSFETGAGQIGQGRTHSPSDHIYGPVPATRHDYIPHIVWSDLGPQGTDDWDIMEESDDHYY